jgi:hypothetical protein
MALGYLDAGTGSMVIGAVAAGVAGAGVALRSTVGRFRRKSKDGPTDADTDTGGDADTTAEQSEPAEDLG